MEDDISMHAFVEQPRPVTAAGYTVERILGRGGMGVAYLARHPGSSAPVVIKMIAPPLREDIDVVARFRREGRRLRGLSHPNIVRFIDFVEAGEQSFLVMEYARGEPLSVILRRRGSLPLQMFAPIAVQALRGVAHAHAQGIVLRDIKASNVMLCPTAPNPEIVKILDFGLAKAIDSDTMITRSQVLGTVGYLAPEVLNGATPDLRSDVFSLGVLFHYMLTGKSPIPGRTAEVLLRTVTHRPSVRALERNPAIPLGLVHLIERCLSPNRDERPTDARRVLAELVRIVRPERLGADRGPSWPTSPPSQPQITPPSEELEEALADLPTIPISLRAREDDEGDTSYSLPAAGVWLGRRAAVYVLLGVLGTVMTVLLATFALR